MRGLRAAVLAIVALACSTRHATIDGGADAAIDAADVGLSLEPASPTLVSAEGSRPSVTLHAFVTRADGSRAEVTPDRFVIDDERVLEADAASRGTFVATARAGGAVTVTAHFRDAMLGDLEAASLVSVRVVRTFPPGPGVPTTLPDRFTTLPAIDAPFDAAAIEYPLEGARMPNNVLAPVVQWYPRGGAGDAYRIVVSSAHAEVTSFAFDDGLRFRSSAALDTEGWRLVSDSTRGEPVTFRVDRIASGGTSVITGAPVSAWLSEDGIFGTLYYWQVRVDPQASDVLRLDAARGVRESVFATEAGRCVGCHALSGDGRHMAATRDGRAIRWVSTFVDLASDTRPPPELFAPIDPGYRFLAFAPAGDRALASRGATDAGADSTLSLIDTATGRSVPSTGLPSGVAGYPAWSPEGARVAWMDGGGDGPRGTTDATRIVVADVLPNDAFGPPTVVHDGSTLALGSLEGGQTDSRPTWSPDGRWLAFAHGTSSISATDIGAEMPRAGLYLVAREGGPALRLDRGMGPEGPVDAFWPVFSPFATEEQDGTQLFWLAFYSRADYGNERDGTAGTARRQLWVMAVDPARARAGEDSSSPPYWLPGQDTQADDIAALWARTACRPRGESCSSSSECCSGECAAADPDLPDVLTCVPPRACRSVGDSCDEASDCCSGTCELGVCGYQVPF